MPPPPLIDWILRLFLDTVNNISIAHFWDSSSTVIDDFRRGGQVITALSFSFFSCVFNNCFLKKILRWQLKANKVLFLIGDGFFSSSSSSSPLDWDGLNWECLMVTLYNETAIIPVHHNSLLNLFCCCCCCWWWCVERTRIQLSNQSLTQLLCVSYWWHCQIKMSTKPSPA